MPIADDAALETAPDRESARRTLALRIAQRNRLRELRAERLARLRPPPLPAAAPPEPDPAEDADAGAALEDFLRALGGGPAPEARAARPAPAAVLQFQRPDRPEAPAAPEAAPPAPAVAACDLDRLPGAGPGLVAALRRAGLARLADVAALEADALAARLGPVGRLVPAAAWIAAARAAVAGPAALPAAAGG